MDIAITGATGFLGAALRARLAADGHRVLSVTRPRTKKPPADTITWDPPAGTIDAAGLEGIDAVVHLAGVSIGSKPGTKKALAEIRDSRTVPTALLSETLAHLQNPPRVLLSQSAIGYYGERGDDLLTEDEPAGSDFLAREVCEPWETSTQPAAKAGIRVAVMRTGLVLGAGGGLLQRLLLPAKMGIAPTFASGKQWQSWIALDDEVGAMTFLLDAPIVGPVNLVGPAPVTNREMTVAVAAAVGRKARLRVPQFALNLGLGKDLGAALTGSQRVVPKKLLDAGFRFRYERIEDALSAAISGS